MELDAASVIIIPSMIVMKMIIHDDNYYNVAFPMTRSDGSSALNDDPREVNRY